MKAVLPLASFGAKPDLPETFVKCGLNPETFKGTKVILPAGTFSSLESAINDPRTVILRDGIKITAYQLRELGGPQIIEGVKL